ncbi:hypothetical protein [Paludisphaera sp.]|uniref:hypothetical protein n=1 Tax=Paludisphaera sp. TaxID=2017432 RepID=UPI00301CDC51
MPITYTAVLRDGRLEWGEDGPPPLPPGAVPVRVTLLTHALPGADGRAMSAALEALAADGGPSIEEPVEWQRKSRDELALLGRAR